MESMVPRGVVPIPSEHDLNPTKSETPRSLQVKPCAPLTVNTPTIRLSGTSGGDQHTIVKGDHQLVETNSDIFAITKKPSCVLTNVVSTCVNKASSHLELLQTLIEEWFANEDSCHGHETLPDSINTQKSLVSRSGKLTVSGHGYAHKTIADELPYLGGMEVLEEVYALIRRLEDDRIDTESGLKSEKQRARMLQRRTDELAKKRAIEFPFAVQREHDAAVEDLNELHWHVTYKQRTEEKLKERVNNANIFNQRLLDDIAFVGKHCPLVEEKLALETEAMEKINAAQVQTDHELEVTLDRLAKTKVRNEEAHVRANQEREQMALDIENVGKELQDTLTELAESRMLHNDYVHQTNDTRTQIAENKEEKEVLLVKCENAKVTEAMHAKKVDELQNKVRLVQSEHHRLEEDFYEKQTDYQTTVSTMESQHNELKKAGEHEEQKLRTITKENENLAIEIDEITRSIGKWEKRIVEDEKTLRRMNNQITNTEMMMNQMLDEYSKVQTINSAIRDRLQEERERTSSVEDSLRQTLESLKKQCKDEIHTRGVLNSRISTDGQDLVKSHSEAKQKKEKLTKTVAQLDETLKIVNNKVDKLREIHKSKTEILDGLQKEIDETVASLDSYVLDYKSSKEKLDPYLKQLKETDSKLRAQISDLNNQLDLMNRKRNEMTNSTRVLERSIKQNGDTVIRLDAELNELNTQLEDQTGLLANLTGTRDDLQRRHNIRVNEHNELVKERMETIAHHKSKLAVELSINSGLASKYRRLQGEHVNIKSKIMDLIDERNRLEASIKDLKQIKGLQIRLRKALETYYKFRGLFNSGELERVISENRVSATKVTRLQDSYREAVTTIARFLQTQMTLLDDRSVVKVYGPSSTITLADLTPEDMEAVKHAATNTSIRLSKDHS